MSIISGYSESSGSQDESEAAADIGLLGDDPDDNKHESQVGFHSSTLNHLSLLPGRCGLLPGLQLGFTFPAAGA